MIELPRCAMCRVTIEPGQTVQFRSDGRTVHAECPKVVCPVCAGVVLPSTPIRRDGEAILHSNCWMRRHRRAIAQRPIDEHIRQEVVAGRLPTLEATRVWAAPGHGALCQACQKLIQTVEAEYEVDFANAVTVRMHRECYVAWRSIAGDKADNPERTIRGGCGASPWTVVFHEQVAKRATRDRGCLAQLLLAAAESRRDAVAIRERALRARCAFHAHMASRAGAHAETATPAAPWRSAPGL